MIEINQAALERIGFTEKSEVLGKNLRGLSPGVEAAGRYAEYREVIRTGNLFAAEDVVPATQVGDRYITAKVFKVGGEEHICVEQGLARA